MSENRNKLNEDQLENVSGGASFSAGSGEDDGSRDFDMNKDEHQDPNFDGGGEPDMRGDENPHEMDGSRGAR